MGNWRDWQPPAGDIGELQSNLTLEEVEKLASEVPIDDMDGIDEMEIDIEETIMVEI